MGVAENLDVYLADWGVPVSFTGAPAGTVGVVDFHDKMVLDPDRGGEARFIGRVRVVRLKTTVAALLTVGMAITVASVNYIVNDPEADKDGAFTLVEVSNPT